MSDCIRLGKISSINYATGMVKVLYENRDDTVSEELPYQSNGEYNMPNIDDFVLVVVPEDASGVGVALGTMWNHGNLPEISGKGVYHKKFDNENNAYLKYDSSSHELILCAKHVKIITDNGIVNF